MKNLFQFCCLLLLAGTMFAQENRELAIGQAAAIVDLRTQVGVDLLDATWRYHPATFDKASFRAPGPSESDPLALYPTGERIKTQILHPRAGAQAYDDSDWETLDPTSLETRRGTGLGSFAWYRIKLTVPERIGKVTTKGKRLVFEIVVDDYAEIWINGRLDKTFGQSGGQVIKGFNARNRVLLTDDARPGQVFNVAILGINGPLADLPDNYIWLRSATLDVYDGYPENSAWQNLGRIVRTDAALDNILAPNTPLTKIADGFQFAEGPVWHSDGYLLFSDPNANVIYKYDPSDHNVSIYITKSGYTGVDIGEYHQPGSNGLAIDQQGRLLVCQHGNRRLIRHERKGPITILADAYQGKRLNSPNDLVLKSDGSVYFTDPPYGLPRNYTDPAKELDHQGVYHLKDGKLTLLSTDLGGPNGLAFSPNEDFLYVGNWDIRDVYQTKTLWRFPVKEDGTLGTGEVFYNFEQTDAAEAIDGVKVDRVGNIFVSAPGGVWILNAAGDLLGKLIGPERPANMAWGGPNGKTLFLTAHTGLYRIETLTGG